MSLVFIKLQRIRIPWQNILLFDFLSYFFDHLFYLAWVFDKLENEIWLLFDIVSINPEYLKDGAVSCLVVENAIVA